MSGSKPGERRGGRKKGTPNKKTAALKQAVAQAVGELIDPFPGDSYAFLATVYKDRALPLHVRMTAATAAIPYERPRLSNVAMVTRSVDQLSDEEFFRALDRLDAFLAQHGQPPLLIEAEQPDGPTPANKRGAELLEKLYGDGEVDADKS